MLGCLVESSGFSEAEIVNMTIDTVRFWWNCIMAYRQHVHELSQN